MSSLNQSVTDGTLMESDALDDSLIKMVNTISGARRELEDLRIPDVEKFLLNILQILENYSIRSVKEDTTAVKKIITILERVDQEILQPIRKAKRCTDMQISEQLAQQLQVFFCSASSRKNQTLPRVNVDRWLNRAEPKPDELLDNATSKIEESLNLFLRQGTIECETSADDRRCWVYQTSEITHEPTQDATTSENSTAIVNKHSRFRILLLGKSGVGKSSLINKIFNVPLADVARYREGGADIDTEIISNSNPYFLFHDSMGYESGSVRQLQKVENFIKARAKKESLSDQVHAIWLLAAIPSSGGRVFEHGDEQVMKMALDHKITLVVVFTKYDILETRIALEYSKLSNITAPNPLPEHIKDKIREDADRLIEGACGAPLEDLYKTKWTQTISPPYTEVSIWPGYEHTLTELVKLTEQNIPKSLWLTWVKAQKIDPLTNLKTSIVRLLQTSRDRSVYQQAEEALTLVSGSKDVTGRLRKEERRPRAMGANSDVWKGSLREQGIMFRKRQPVAIKVLRSVRIKQGEEATVRLLTRLQREIRIWGPLNHDNIVPLLGFAFEEESPCMVAPWYENGTVLKYISENPEADRLKLTLDILNGLIHLHSRNPPIVHGDLRGCNVMVDDDGSARISDFGLSRISQNCPSGYTTSSAIQGSTRWMAPELLNDGRRPTEATDIYAFGLLVMEIDSGGTTPFCNLSDSQFLRVILVERAKLVPYEPSVLEKNIYPNLEACWSRDPCSRPTAVEMRTLASML
ncbi:hypothetical protein FRC03_012542 [Tulasnella sp. 419]|nr:hypothetical protein FRC03_012542 [Tulasnella sp. 419]